MPYELIPPTLLSFFVAILGLIFGSFTNVLIFRIPRHQSILRPRSQCPGCGTLIRWVDNIPVFSYLWLKGKCRSCRAPISFRYPVVELLTAFLFLAVYKKFGWGVMLWARDWPFVVLLLAITFIDLEHRIIPDPLSLGGLVLGLATSWMIPDLGLIRSALGAALGFCLFYALAWIYHRLAGRMGLGGGDIKLLAMLGAFLGPMGVVVTLLVSSLLGSGVGVLWALVTREKNILKTAIPYGPFLVIGGLYYYLLGDPVWFQFMIPM